MPAKTPEAKRRKNARSAARAKELKSRKPGRAKTCECESPWPQREEGYVDPDTGFRIEDGWSCAKCSREIV